MKRKVAHSEAVSQAKSEIASEDVEDRLADPAAAPAPHAILAAEDLPAGPDQDRVGGRRSTRAGQGRASRGRAGAQEQRDRVIRCTHPTENSVDPDR